MLFSFDMWTDPELVKLSTRVSGRLRGKVKLIRTWYQSHNAGVISERDTPSAPLMLRSNIALPIITSAAASLYSILKPIALKTGAIFFLAILNHSFSILI